MQQKIIRQSELIIPTPKAVERQEGYCQLPTCIFAEDPTLSTLANTFCDCVFKLFGKAVLTAKGGITLRLDPTLPQGSYTLDTRKDVLLSASSEEGIGYALATLFQMIAEIDGKLYLARVYVQDTPDKEYRALMVDLAREWHPLEQVLKYIDICFLLKIRYLHLHFIDDQRYTLPSRVFPDVTKYSRHYTYEEIAHLRAYAKTRNILLIPEIEVPGHAAMLVKTYPEIFALHLNGESGSTLVTEGGAVITARNIVCAGSQVAENAIHALLSEICEMFPDSPYIHIGGDEANIRAWESCAECLDYMKRHGISDVYELYSEFTGRVARMVLSLGRTPIVWEGFPETGVHYIPKETVVIAWESHYQTADRLLANGFRIINSSWQPLYIVPNYRLRWGATDILAWNVFNWQHWWEKSVATNSPIQLAPTNRVLGAQLCSWECTYEEEIGKILENLATVSERTWNVGTPPDTAPFLSRLRQVAHRIARLIQDV